MVSWYLLLSSVHLFKDSMTLVIVVVGISCSFLPEYTHIHHMIQKHIPICTVNN